MTTPLAPPTVGVDPARPEIDVVHPLAWHLVRLGPPITETDGGIVVPARSVQRSEVDCGRACDEIRLRAGTDRATQERVLPPTLKEGDPTAKAREHADRVVTDTRDLSRERVILAFLRELWGEGMPDGTVLVLFHLGTHEHRLLPDLAGAARLLGAGEFACFGCALMRPDVQSRGTAADALAIPGLWFDLDLLGGDHDETALPTYAEAFDFIDALPHLPTLVLHSGGGLYLWWAFREPWTFESAAEREEAQGLARGWQAFILEQAAARGWRLDNTSSLSQLLRAEGALNTKYQPPREVKRIRTGGPRWNPCDFEEWCAPETPSRHKTELPKEVAPWVSRAINGLDVATRVLRRDGLVHAVVLELCPACGGVQQTRLGPAKWTAHVAPISGALRCKRQSCEARESTDGGGLEPALWISRFLAPEVVAEVQRLRAPPPVELDDQPHESAPNTVTLAEADGGRLDQRMEEAVNFALSGRRIALFVATLGAGKTRAIIERLARHGGAYFARNHKLLEEVGSELHKSGVPFVHVQGVGQACHFREAYEFYGRRPDWRATACRTCPHLEDGSCRAWDIPKEKVILAPHAALRTLHGTSVVDTATGQTKRVLANRLLIIDEGGHFVETVAIDRDRLRIPLNNPGSFGNLAGIAGQMSLMIDALLTRCIARRIEDPKRGQFPSRYGGAELSAMWTQATAEWESQRVDWFLASAANVNANSWPRPWGAHLRERKLDREKLIHPDIRKVWQLLPGSVASDESVREQSQERLGWLEVVATDTDSWIEIRAPWTIPLGRKSGVLMLDATGRLTRAELQAANPSTPIREFTLNVMPRPEARLLCVHVDTKSVSRRRLLESGALTPRGLGTLRSALREAGEHALEHNGKGIHRCGLITYKAIADTLAENAQLRRGVTPSGLDLSSETIGYYGNDERGSNRFIGVRVLISFGDPVSNIGAAEADGRTLNVPAQELIDGRTAATLVQAHGRSRSLRAEGPMLHVHVGRVRPPGWSDCKIVGLSPGRLPSDARGRLESIVELLWKSGEVAPVPVVSRLVSGGILLPEGLFRTAYEALIGSSAKTPPVLPATLHRWISEEAARLGATSSPVRMPDSGWTVWHMPTMLLSEVVVRARRWWRVLETCGLSGGEEVEWSA